MSLEIIVNILRLHPLFRIDTSLSDKVTLTELIALSKMNQIELLEAEKMLFDQK